MTRFLKAALIAMETKAASKASNHSLINIIATLEGKVTVFASFTFITLRHPVKRYTEIPSP
jgi:hypothetical protein